MINAAVMYVSTYPCVCGNLSLCMCQPILVYVATYPSRIRISRSDTPRFSNFLNKESVQWLTLSNVFVPSRKQKYTRLLLHL